MRASLDPNAFPASTTSGVDLTNSQLRQSDSRRDREHQCGHDAGCRPDAEHDDHRDQVHQPGQSLHQVEDRPDDRRHHPVARGENADRYSDDQRNDHRHENQGDRAHRIVPLVECPDQIETDNGEQGELPPSTPSGGHQRQQRKDDDHHVVGRAGQHGVECVVETCDRGLDRIEQPGRVLGQPIECALDPVADVDARIEETHGFSSPRSSSDCRVSASRVGA